VQTNQARAIAFVGKSGRHPLLAAVLLALAAVIGHPRPATAEGRSALVLVSVRVVETCRVEASNAVRGDALDLSVRCHSKARPSIGLATSSRALAPVGTLSVPQSQIATTENGRTLNIDF